MQSRRFVLSMLASAPLLSCLGGCGSAGASGQRRQPEGAPSRSVPGCEGCEAVWERRPGDLLPAITLASPDERGEPLRVEGTIYHSDGRTPASNVVLYVHHTNAQGRYADGSDESEWSRRHGRLRGWLRTGKDGTYKVHTIKPAPYPGRTNPAHIHMFVLEPDKRDPYWIDDVVFDGEFGVDARYRSARANQGGSGIVRLQRMPDGILRAARDIVLLA